MYHCRKLSKWATRCPWFFVLGIALFTIAQPATARVTTVVPGKNDQWNVGDRVRLQWQSQGSPKLSDFKVVNVNLVPSDDDNATPIRFSVIQNPDDNGYIYTRVPTNLPFNNKDKQEFLICYVNSDGKVISTSGNVEILATDDDDDNDDYDYMNNKTKESKESDKDYDEIHNNNTDDDSSKDNSDSSTGTTDANNSSTSENPPEITVTNHSCKSIVLAKQELASMFTILAIMVMFTFVF